MSNFLLTGGYVGLLDLHLTILLALVGWRAAELRQVGGLAAAAATRSGPRRWMAALLMGGIVLLALLLRVGLPQAPQVYFDEFWYLATAHRMAITDVAGPLLYAGLPPWMLPASEFRPPYPQGWPYLLSWVLWAVPAAEATFSAGVWVERAIGVLAPLALFGMLCGESLMAAGFAGAALAAMPAFVRLSTGAPAEGSSLLFVILFLWAARSYRHRPGLAGAMLVVAVGAWAVHFRPENFLYLPLFLAVAFGPRLSQARLSDSPGPWPRAVIRHPWRARVLLALLLLLLTWPDALILVEGARGPRAREHFEAIPRPGFATITENALANVRGNLAFLVDGRVLPVWVTPLALAGSLVLWRRRWRTSVMFYWGWVGLFIAALSPYPFGDFGARYSFDTWRFSLHVTLPLLLLGARCLEWSARGLQGAGRGVLTLGATMAVLFTAVGYGEFVHRPHGMESTWRSLREVREFIAPGGVVVVADASLAVTLREGLGVDACWGPVNELEAAAFAHRRHLYFLDTTVAVPLQWSRFPLQIEWLSPIGFPPSPRPAPRIILYAWHR